MANETKIDSMDNFQTFSQFLDYIDKNYNEEQNIIIENLMLYYINKYRKFGNIIANPHIMRI